MLALTPAQAKWVYDSVADDQVKALEERIRAEKKALHLKRSEHLLMSSKLFTENEAADALLAETSPPPQELFSGHQDRNMVQGMKRSEELKRIGLGESTVANAR